MLYRHCFHCFTRLHTDKGRWVLHRWTNGYEIERWLCQDCQTTQEKNHGN